MSAGEAKRKESKKEVRINLSSFMDKEEKQEMLKYPSPQPSRVKEIGNLKEIIPPFLMFLSYFLQ